MLYTIFYKSYSNNWSQDEDQFDTNNVDEATSKLGECAPLIIKEEQGSITKNGMEAFLVQNDTKEIIGKNETYYN